MSSKKTVAPIIIKRIKKGDHGHHGGAWKVAYADFVTAMMVFFLLLWLLSSVPEETLEGLGNYFTPTVFEEEHGSGLNISKELETALKEQILEEMGIDQNDVRSVLEKRMSGFVQEKFGDSVNIINSDDGIIIRVESTNVEPLFDSTRAILLPTAKEKLRYIAQLIADLPYYVSISGHIDDKEFTSDRDNDKWNVSMHRANNARKFLAKVGLEANRITQVEAKSDIDIISSDNFNNIRNRRIEVKLLDTDKVALSKQTLPE